MAMDPAAPTDEPMADVGAAMKDNGPMRSDMNCEMRPAMRSAVRSAVRSAMGSCLGRSASGGDRQSGHAGGRERINSDRRRH